MSDEKVYEKIDKEEFIRILAERAQFTIKDTKIFWRTVEEIFHDAVVNNVVLDLRGFGRLYYRTIPARRGFDAVRNEYADFPEAERVMFTPAENFRNIKKKKRPRRKK